MLVEFQELIDTDPVVRMYLNQMIDQVPSTKPYRKRHLESVQQMLRLINEVLTMAPEFGEAMVATPLGAILDWTMGTPAGFAAFRDPRINTMLQKVLTAWCEFLSSGDSLYVLNDSPSGWKCPRPGARSGSSSSSTTRRTSTGASLVERLLHPTLPRGARPVASPDDDRVIVKPASPRPTASAPT